MYSMQPSLILINLINNTERIVSKFDVIDDIIGNTLMGNTSINITRRQKWNMTLMLKYNCSSLTVNLPTKIICKFI